MIIITSSEIPAIPSGTTFLTHEDASCALSTLAQIMPQTWDAFKYSVGCNGVSTPLTEIRCGEQVDTAKLITSWVEHAIQSSKQIDYQRAFVTK